MREIKRKKLVFVCVYLFNYVAVEFVFRPPDGIAGLFHSRKCFPPLMHPIFLLFLQRPKPTAFIIIIII